MSKLLDGLNPSQREAVMHETGPLLIIAGPGSGKTRTVVHSIAYAIENREVVPGRIVAFTFTRKSAKDLKNKVSEVVGHDIVNDICISTFHSFCGHVINTDVEKLGIVDTRGFTVNELTRIYKERIRAHIDYIQHHQFGDAQEIHNFISKCEANGTSPEAARDYVPHPQSSQMYVEIYKRYKQISEEGTDNYTKAQLFANALFRDIPEVKVKWQEKFDLIFVDEYQDTDPVQYQIIKALAEKRQDLRVVGDDDQGIYGWRGADIKNILNFEKDFPNAKVISLGQNYRSTKQIVDASRSIIDFSPHRREKDLFTNNADGQKVKHLHCENHEAEAATIARFIRRAIQTGWAANDFAVLCRSTKSQAITFEETFSNLAIPYHVVDDSPDIQTNGVSIMTIHKSKGLEFSNVFVTGVCSELLPHYNSKKEDWDEELRLLYVAMTRAENWLCLSSYNKDESFSRGPSRFLDFIPRSLVERIETLDNTAIPLKFKKRIIPEDVEESQEYSTPLPIRVQTVLGIDPGKENVGWSITQKLSGGYTVCKYDTDNPIEGRIERKFNELIELHSPDAISVEKLDGTTEEWFRYVAACVAQIRSIADQHGIECHFYSPQDVKYAVTGDRKASKEAVQHAVKKVCNLKKIPEPHHSADAIAVSLCYLRNYLNYSRFQDNARKQEHYNTGCAYLDNGQYYEAIAEFEEAINNASMIDPMYIKAHCGLGRAYLGQDKLVAAEKSAKEALRLDDNYQPAFKLLESIKQKYCEHGGNYLNQNDLVSAEKSAKEALRLDDNYQLAFKLLESIKQAYYNRGHNHYDNQRYGEAIAAFEETINKFPSFIKAHCGLGRAYLGQDKLVAAEKSAKEVLRADGNCQPALKILESIKQKYCEHGRNYLNQDDLVSAEKSTKEALRLDDNYQLARELLDAIKQAYYNRGHNHYDNQRYDEAIAAFEETTNKFPSFATAYCGLGLAYLEQGDLPTAEKSAKEALRLDSNCQSIYELLTIIKQKYYKQGLVYIANNEYANAVEPLLKARDIDQSDKDVHANLGRAYYWLEDHANAASCCRKVTTIDPDDKYGHINLGNSYYRMSEYDEAIKPLQKASDIDPNCIKTLYYLARAYFRQGRLEVARQIASKVLNIDINHHAANKLLGDIKCVIDFQMTRIPAGEFEIESNEAETMENPRQTVYVDAFYMDIYVVTNALYKKFVDVNPQWQKTNISKTLHDGNYLKHWKGNNYPIDKGNYPVTYVSWYAAKAYAQWIGKRLPTEAEWEKAARGGLEGKKYPWGDSIDETKANFVHSIGYMTSVGKYPPNNYGLYDMTGNVWEWTYPMLRDRSWMRGGSSCSTARFARVTAHCNHPVKFTDLNLGFRCVRTAID